MVRDENPLGTQSGCLKKKKEHGVANLQYFLNGAIQQCNILRHNKYNFHLDVHEV